MRSKEEVEAEAEVEALVWAEAKAVAEVEALVWAEMRAWRMR